jgi:DNA-binding MarR family transcriptional regulator
MLLAPQIEATLIGRDLTFVQWTVLMALRDGVQRTAADIAREMCHDTGALTRVLDQLCQRSFVTRERSTEDRRIVLLGLTPGGACAVQATIPPVVALLNQALDGFTMGEFETLCLLLTRLIEGLSRTGRRPDYFSAIEAQP